MPRRTILTAPGKTCHTFCMTYHITMVESEEGVAVWCDDLPGCCSQGANRPEAIANIKAAIADYRDAQQQLERDTNTRIFHEELAV